MAKAKKKEIVLNKTQQRVYDYIKEFGSITSLQAFKDLGETRLSARIYEMREKGIKIDSEDVIVKNRFKEKRRVSKYVFG